MLVHCAQGRDRSVGVALAVLATCFDEDLALDAERCAAVAAGGPVALDRGRGKERLCRLLNVVVKARPRAGRARDDEEAAPVFLWTGVMAIDIALYLYPRDPRHRRGAQVATSARWRPR